MIKPFSLAWSNTKCLKIASQICVKVFLVCVLNLWTAVISSWNQNRFFFFCFYVWDQIRVTNSHQLQRPLTFILCYKQGSDLQRSCGKWQTNPAFVMLNSSQCTHLYSTYMHTHFYTAYKHVQAVFTCVFGCCSCWFSACRLPYIHVALTCAECKHCSCDTSPCFMKTHTF